ncbi:hypothetical protein SPI_04334 [Niveomyces insectorum RCEF 264]|uniref:MARVEL-like domain protein n=1 Tax=Niveomyces insectorum RCEF 264 TaxID=1081102 RepID=A0A167VMR3_9HYPO|nr:hypothetical protein SPI_04334 [Niveomyces insectorum RCEF 264]
MLFAVFFAFWRFLQIITLIPTMGMLAWFVNAFIRANELAPNYVLILFVVSVLGVVWCLFTLFSYHRSSANAQFVALIDLGFVGALIGAVYDLHFISDANCTTVSVTDSWLVSAGNLVTLGPQGVDVATSKPCATLKACFAFGIMNCVFFFFTAVLAWMHGGKSAASERDRRYVRETTTVHRHHSRGGSRGPSSRPRSGSHHSHHSSHSHGRAYV